MIKFCELIFTTVSTCRNGTKGPLALLRNARSGGQSTTFRQPKVCAHCAYANGIVVSKDIETTTAQRRG
jgi:hypothetical protein